MGNCSCATIMFMTLILDKIRRDYMKFFCKNKGIFLGLKLLTISYDATSNSPFSIIWKVHRHLYLILYVYMNVPRHWSVHLAYISMRKTLTFMMLYHPQIVILNCFDDSSVTDFGKPVSFDLKLCEWIFLFVRFLSCIDKDTLLWLPQTKLPCEQLYSIFALLALPCGQRRFACLFPRKIISVDASWVVHTEHLCE